MTQDKFKTEDARRFLLGRMTDDEREEFERAFLSGADDGFDAIRATEDELIEDFHRDRLNPADRRDFIELFFDRGRRERRVVLHGDLLRRLDAEREAGSAAVVKRAGILSGLAAFFRNPRFALAGLALLITSAVLLLVFSTRTKDRDQIARVDSPTPALSNVPSATPVPSPSAAPTVQDARPQASPATTASTTPTPGSTPGPTPSPTPNSTPEKPLRPVIATLTLFPGLSRSDGAVGQLKVGPETKSINLRLRLESRDYQNYRAEIVDPDGNVLSRTGKIVARGTRVDATFDAAKLRGGDYLVKLYGFSSTGAEESAAEYQLRINRK